MIPLDERTARTLIRAIDILQDEDSIDLRLRDHPLLRIQRMEPVRTEEGSGYTFSIGQLHQLDPPRYEARMILIVIDQRNRETWQGSVTVFPISYHDDVNEVVEIGALLAKGQVRKFNAMIQQSLSENTRTWLAELHTAGYF